jgi:hypothetical protein
MLHECNDKINYTRWWSKQSILRGEAESNDCFIYRRLYLFLPLHECQMFCFVQHLIKSPSFDFLSAARYFPFQSLSVLHKPRATGIYPAVKSVFCQISLHVLQIHRTFNSFFCFIVLTASEYYSRKHILIIFCMKIWTAELDCLSFCIKIQSQRHQAKAAAQLLIVILNDIMLP